MSPLAWSLAHQLPPGAPQGNPGGAVSQAADTALRFHDTLAGSAGVIRDTLGTPPLPGGVAAFVRFLFRVPQWIQIGGIVLAALVAGVVLLFLWRRREAMLGWLESSSRGVKVALGGSLCIILALFAFGGKRSWDYMQHDNGFCTGCHIMEKPFGRFETLAGKHENRKCHDCHQQSIFASTRQLVLWVANRPDQIGTHAPVPNSRCLGCHQVDGGKKPWEHALYLAGHKTHFESDSAKLKKLLCVTCHGKEIHKFIPSARTCQQEGCHVKQSVKLAGMSKLPLINCVTCHAFTADLPPLATHDSAMRALIPAASQCRSCHQMDGKPPGYVLARDPHKGYCGYCHDVHTDSLPSAAKASCTKCHTNLASSAFHTGANHKRVAQQCLTCHNPHAASLDASDCVGCHTSVRQRGLFHPPVPFDTNAVLQRKISAEVHLVPPAATVEEDPPLNDHRGKGDALPEELPATRDSPVAVVPPPLDSFPHSRHTSLPCLTCHTINTANRYGLVFAVPRGCDLCHHQGLLAGTATAADCARCHRSDSLAVPRPMTVTVQVGQHPPAARTVAFPHTRHARVACTTCHQAPNTTPPDSVRTCVACHDQHHRPGRNCATCHNRPETAAAHTRTTHTGCDACHTRSRIAELVPTRNFCLVCHAPQKNHQPGRECATCHFLQSPAEYKTHLLTGGAG